MKIDRSRFLFLTATLAVAACNKPKTEAKPDAKAKDTAAADKKAAEPAADKQEQPAPAEPEAEAKGFGIKGTPEVGPEGDALPPIEPEPEDNSAPSPHKE